MSYTDDATEPVADDAGHDVTAPEVADEATPHSDYDHETTDSQAESDLTDSEQSEPGDPGFEVEHNGQKYRVHSALRDNFMWHEDYTKKTQAVGQARQAVEQHERVLKTREEFLDDHMEVKKLEKLLADRYHNGNVDWDRLEDEDPDLAAREWRKYQQVQSDLNAAKTSLRTKQEQYDSEVKSMRDRALHETSMELRRTIPGWDEHLALKVMESAAKNYGATHEYLSKAEDPVTWKLIHAAYQWEQHKQKQATAARVEQAAGTAPLRTVGSNAPPTNLDPRKMTMAQYKAARESGRI